MYQEGQGNNMTDDFEKAEWLQNGEKNRNPHLKAMKNDFLYHLGLQKMTHRNILKDKFGDVRFVCMGGTQQRMRHFAEHMNRELGYNLPLPLEDITGSFNRYSMFKVGPVLSISHGIGFASLSILLHEVFKLLWHAGVNDAIFFRIGTCGGIGVAPGTVCITNAAIDGKFRSAYCDIVLGRDVSMPSVVDKTLAKQISTVAISLNIPSKIGTTMASNDFYEGQGRMDGAFCRFSTEERNAYMKALGEHGVINIEMESTNFTAMTHRAGFKAAIVCVAMVNRYEGDQIDMEVEVKQTWERRPQILVGQYIKKCLLETKKE